MTPCGINITVEKIRGAPTLSTRHKTSAPPSPFALDAYKFAAAILHASGIAAAMALNYRLRCPREDVYAAKAAILDS
jgi:hypothetical protein